MKRYLYLLSFLLFLSACGHKPEKLPAPDPAREKANLDKIGDLRAYLHSGDLIFRNGTDEVSQAARSFNRKDTSYSHCGLVFIEHDSAVVYHALGGVYNPSQKLLREPLERFCNPEENNTVAAYRYPLNSEELGLLEKTVHNYYHAGLKFDLYFNFLTDDRMYCAEFVFKSLNRALGQRLSAYVRMDTIPYGVTTDDLFLHPDSKFIRKEKFTD